MQFPFLEKRNNQKHILSDLDLITKNPSPVLSEALKTARINLMYSLADIEGGKCVLMTSALVAEGKTTTCINLAVSLAQTESRVLLIDADMRCPRMHRYLDLKNTKGLANYLGGFCELADVVHHLDAYNLDIITAGDLPPNPTELLSSQKMQTLIDTVKENYDYILFDTPPINVVADSLAMVRLIPNVAFICKCHNSIMAEVEKALSTLKFAGAKILGFITIDAYEKKRSENYSEYYCYQGTKES